MFKVGEKVVYIGGDAHHEAIEPQKGEIVTIQECCDDYLNRGMYVLEGYVFDKDGDEQVFYMHELRKLNDRFAESVLEYIEEQASIEEQIKQNQPELA